VSKSLPDELPDDQSALLEPPAPDPQGAALRALAVALALGAALPLGAAALHPRDDSAARSRHFHALAARAAGAPSPTAERRRSMSSTSSVGRPDDTAPADPSTVQEAQGTELLAVPDTATLPIASSAESESSPAADPGTAPSPRPTPWRHYPVPAVARASEVPFPSSVYRWQPLVESELDQLRRSTRVDPALTTELVLAVMREESLGDPESVSAANAVGLMQVLPSTFADFFADADPFDPVLNIRAGIRYLNAALLEYDGDVEWALAAYYLGFGEARAAKASNDVSEDTIQYVADVLFWRDRALLARGLAPPPAPESLPLPRATTTPTPPPLPPPAALAPEPEAPGEPRPARLQADDLNAGWSPTPPATSTRTATPRPSPSAPAPPSATPSLPPSASPTPQSPQPVPSRPAGPTATGTVGAPALTRSTGGS